jgi:hypothetical protein
MKAVPPSIHRSCPKPRAENSFEKMRATFRLSTPEADCAPSRAGSGMMSAGAMTSAAIPIRSEAERMR